MAQANKIGNYTAGLEAVATDLDTDLTSILTILNTITTEQLDSNIVTESKILNAAVTLAKLLDGMFTADTAGRAKFATGFVNSDLLADDTKRPYLRCIEQQSDGTDSHAGAVWTSGAWTTRFLNQKSDDDVTATLSSNAITLPSGTYQCHISAPAQLVNSHQARLHQTSGTPTTILLGTVENNSASATSITRSFIAGQFTLSVSQTLEVQHYTDRASSNTTRFGENANFGNDEIYTIAEFWKVA